MGRKLDALLALRFKTSKLKTTLNLAVSRVQLLNNHRFARFTISRSDIIQLLHLNHHQQALLRVEQVIKDQNMLDVYDMIHGYCHLLVQRINHVEQANNCPGELKEAVSSILYAAPRCGEFPELQEIRAILTARFGKEFVNDSIDLRSRCGVNQKMIEKLSPKQSSLECRMKVLTGIAKEIGVVLQLEIASPEIIKEKSVEVAATVLPDKIEKVLCSSYSIEGRKKYRDVEDAAQDAFQSAAYDSESEYEEIIEENESERSNHNMKVEEYDDLYSDDYSDNENLKSFKKKMDFDESNLEIENNEKGFPSRNAYFSSYKQFPVKHQTKTKAGLGR